MDGPLLKQHIGLFVQKSMKMENRGQLSERRCAGFLCGKSEYVSSSWGREPT